MTSAMEDVELNSVVTDNGASKSTKEGPVVSFHNISYTIPVKTKCGGKCGAQRDKVILNNISGLFKQGMNAILGPTGSGKSSLLDILAQRKDPDCVSGDVLINGRPQPANFKCMAGYVVQDDVVMGTLTVRENLTFSASLRLPSSVSQKERKERVDNIIRELGLSHCADTKVGTEFIRGVSGGERKRTNIGMELINQPHVLFLDEPTTGLDSSTANAVMLLLQRLSKKGNTIIFSIHQPRFSIFKLFDSMALLSKGQMVYHGQSAEALDYFSSIGYDCEVHNNPPDFFLDVINGDSTAVAATLESKTASNGTSEKGTEGDTDLSLQLREHYVKSPWHDSIEGLLDPIYKDYQDHLDSGIHIKKARVVYPTSFLTQCYHVSGRAVKNLARNPQTSVMQLMTTLITGVIMGAIFWQSDLSVKSGIQNRIGSLFFISTNLLFGNLSAIELFLKERVIFIHENASGFYRVSAYFIAKLFCDIIPNRAIPTSLLAVVTYFMIGFQVDVGKFFFFLLSLLTTTLSASSLAFAISASVNLPSVANLFISLCYVFMMIFSGLLVNLDSVGPWLHWLQYFSIVKYSLSALSINELKELKFCGTTSNATLSLATGQTCTLGTDYLDLQGIVHATMWDLWLNIVAQVCITVICMTLTYIQLRRIKKIK